MDKNFHKTNAAEHLFKAHSLDEIGIWQVLGEDSNCDFGGPHHQPTLGYFEGKLSDVIDYAGTLSGFWTWGYGGDIKRVTIQTVDQNTVRHATDLKLRKSELETERKRIDDELRSLGIR